MNKKENWSSHFGVILAVAGSAVGLGNFLKFPGQVASYGGAAFMIAYVASFFLLGMPISIVEWTIGRNGGHKGFNSPPGLLAQICPWKHAKYVGLMGVMLTIIVYCYYVYIESWCAGYALNFALGSFNFGDISESGKYFDKFIGSDKDGSALVFGLDGVLVFFCFSYILNFWLIYRGVSKGIEMFCKVAMPTLLILALILVLRVMTLGNVVAEYPERNVAQGMGFMWNPTKLTLQEKTPSGEWTDLNRIVGEIELSRANLKIAESAKDPQNAQLRVKESGILEQLLNPSIWIAAAGQVFFSLTVGFGSIMTYASYLRKRDDVVLSSLTSASANEFCEVCLGGLITVPAAVAFFGVSGAIGAGLSLFDLGFRVLPLFFGHIEFGAFFGFLFFALLYLAAITSSLSMLQPGIAFIEEAMNLGRKMSVLIMGLITFFISGFVMYFSQDLKAMDTFDFWIGQVAVYLFAMAQVCIFAWVLGADKGVKMANYSSLIKLPRGFAFVIKYITPLFLITVFITWIVKETFDLGDGSSRYITDIFGNAKGEVNHVAWLCIIIIAALFLFLATILATSKKYKKLGSKKEL